MNASLEQNVEIMSDHYVERFKFLLEGEMLNLQVMLILKLRQSPNKRRLIYITRAVMMMILI